MINENVGKCMTVAELAFVLTKIPRGEWLIVVNKVGNLALYDKEGNIFMGYIDFLDGTVDLVENMGFLDYPEGAINIVKKETI
jgi:hypothetical protein